MAAGAAARRLRPLLDEMCSPRIAEQLRARGHDVVGALERDELRGLSDEDLFVWAAQDRRAIVTFDVGDLSELALRVRAAEQHHCGVILVPSRRFSPSATGIGALVRALDAVLGAHPGVGDLVNDTLWLERE